MDTPPLTILLVDDQSMFLDGIESLLARLPEVQVVAKATNGLDALAKVTLHKPDLVLMDINMPHMDGIEASKHIRKANPATRVIALSMYGHREFVLELLDSGVGGYLLKTAGKDELLTAIRTVAQGDQYVAQELRTLANKAVKLILHDRTTAEIAAELFLSTTTVETHRRNIMHKLDVRNTAGLVKYAMERGWGA